MNTQQDFLARACEDLGIRIVSPYDLELDEGAKIMAIALLPDLGGPKGMLIVKHFDALVGHTDHLVECGFSYSVLDDPLPNEAFDCESYKEMFRDWGWGNDKTKTPQWMD